MHFRMIFSQLSFQYMLRVNRKLEILANLSRTKPMGPIRLHHINLEAV